MKRANHSSDAASLGPLQREVLEYVWDHRGCSARDVLDALNAGREQPYAYTTVSTVLDALHKKKLVKRRRRKNTYHYTARESRSGLFGEHLKSLFSRLRLEPEPVASSLVDYLETDDPEQLEALVAELKRRGKI